MEISSLSGFQNINGGSGQICEIFETGHGLCEHHGYSSKVGYTTVLYSGKNIGKKCFCICGKSIESPTKWFFDVAFRLKLCSVLFYCFAVCRSTSWDQHKLSPTDIMYWLRRKGNLSWGIWFPGVLPVLPMPQFQVAARHVLEPWSFLSDRIQQ